MFSATKSSPLFSLGRISASSSKPNFSNIIISMKDPSYLALTNQHRNLSVSCTSHSQNGSIQVLNRCCVYRNCGELQENVADATVTGVVFWFWRLSKTKNIAALIVGGEVFFRDVLESMQSVYLNRNPTAKAILDLVHSVENNSLCYDHLAFRTFGVNGYGIDSMASFFLDYGYTQRDELRFPAKKLRALWFSPPTNSLAGSGSGINGPLPRIFISELLVDQMSPKTQEIIRKYTESSGNGNKYAALASSLGLLTWEKPLYSDFQQLASESEYAAWTLVNGHALNHVTISAHRLKTHLREIKKLNQFIEESGFRLNSEGGVLKVSPDGLLLQSSTVADSVSFQFSDGITKSVPCSYIEFAERLVLPQYENLPDTEVEEFHRRDGFEVASADKIFESTSKEQLSRVGS